MIVGRLQNDQLQIIDRLREPVRLAAGITDDDRLEDKTRRKALDCLQRFGQRIRELPDDSVRVVGTNTLRRIQSDNRFLADAQQALGHAIEIISGIEEARLVHLGVAHSLSEQGIQRLVVDIGGGSTEIIIGQGCSPLRLESLYMGCVSMSQRFFADGVISKIAMKQAVLAARLELQPHKQIYRQLGWSMAIGSSGTIRTIRDLVMEAGWSDNGISADSLKKLRDTLVRLEHTDNIDYASVSDDRKPVLAGGVAILSAVFHALKIDRMLHSSGALREGLLYEQLGRIRHHDIREATVQSLAKRYHIDLQQAQRVEDTAQALCAQVGEHWFLRQDDARQWLHWASLLHEVGLVIAHSQYHRHGAYLVEYSDLPGFSLRDQRFLSVLVRCHRRKFLKAALEGLPEKMHATAIRLATLLRLSVLLHRSRSQQQAPDIGIAIDDKLVSLRFPQGWLEEHPLTRTDLDIEKKHLKPAGLKLEYS
ncbi:MAG TPA: Ppx/GppA family phosphatase [Gammaproteobacteria bacterium]|nr:Ppx/GppA family phosphatase [Gammaproteobacteria bacterium]